jgi:hypothetical protein
MLIEFGVGTPGMFAAGVFATKIDEGLIGWYLILLGLNRMPLLIYALLMVRNGTAKERNVAESEVSPKIFNPAIPNLPAFLKLIALALVPCN